MLSNFLDQAQGLGPVEEGLLGVGVINLSP